MTNLPAANKYDNVEDTRNYEKVTREDELMVELVRDYTEDNGES
jgi:hypothetical protein